MKRILKRVSLGRSLKILVEKGLVREVEKGCCSRKNAGWKMASLRFERGYWLWRGKLVENWLVIALREDTARGGAC